MNSACTSSSVGAAAAARPAWMASRSPTVDGRRNSPAPTNATLTSTNRISDAIITAAMPDCVSIMETPDTVNAHRLLAARPMPAHSCGVCMRGASCKNVVVKNVTKNPELT